MAGDASVHFRSYGGTLDEDIDQSVDAYASAIVHKHPNITDTAARVAIGEGFELFIGLITEDPSIALTEASKLSDKDCSTATAHGLGSCSATTALPPKMHFAASSTSWSR